jgi:hypothetical protein
MIKTIEFEVAHFIKIANPCFKSRVEHEIKNKLHSETLKDLETLFHPSEEAGSDPS